MNKLISIVDKIFNIILTIIFILAICLGIYAVYDNYKVNDAAQLSDDILGLRPSDDAVEYSFSDLKNINEDITAWIRIDDTSIDYPIVIGEDNSEYLDKNYQKEFSTSGSIFLDYRNDKDFKDDYSIIYGHNMKSNVMFSDVKSFENAEYFSTHKTGFLYTNDDTYKLQVISLSKVSAYENKVFNVMSYANGRNGEIIEFFNSNHIFNNKDIELNENDKLLLLSTCTETGPNEREVLFVKMTKLSECKDLKVNSNQLKDPDESDNANVRKEMPKDNKIIDLSCRSIALIILTIIVIIIFIIALIQKINIWKNKD